MAGSNESMPDDPLAAAGRRTEVALAALRVFLARGYAGASMTAVAREAGITKSSLYHHFRSKEEMFVAALAADVARPLDALGALEGRTDLAPDVRWREALGLAHDAFGGQSMGTLATVIAETGRSIPAVARSFHEKVILRFRGPTRAIYAAATLAGTHRPLPDRTIDQIVFGPLLSNAMTETMFAGTPDLAEANLAGTDRAAFVAMIDDLTTA